VIDAVRELLDEGDRDPAAHTVMRR